VKAKYALLVALVGILLGAGALWHFHAQPKRYAGPVEKVTIGVLPMQMVSLVYLAQEQGFFKANGVDVTLKEYEAGIPALKDLVAGKLDLAAPADFAFVKQDFQNSDLRVIATVASADNIQFVARKDRGVERPADLKGKRVGVAFGTQSEFFLRTSLSGYGLARDEVKVVDLRPDEAGDAITHGRVDAVVTWEPHVHNLKKLLGSAQVSWSAQDGQPYYLLLVSRNKLLISRPVATERLLKGLLEAERFATERKAEAQKIVGRWLGVEEEYLAATWANNRFEVRLDQDLLILMDDEAKWIIGKGASGKRGIPGYFGVLSYQPLERLKPQAVTIIH
jgi:NitT/TauT family transport system substrate-binding protein